MLTDYHCHCLPEIDDGAKDVNMSVAMLTMLKEQGIERVIATPHFYSHKKTVEEFLQRRTQAYTKLTEVYSNLTVIPGTEVNLQNGISEIDGIEKLAIENSRVILLELPYAAFKPWMPQEICNIAYQFELTPLIAHFDRYLHLYKKDELEEILSIEDVVLQINNEAFNKRASSKFVLGLIKQGVPVVFGSDAHNLDIRAPDTERMLKALGAKLTKIEFSALLELNSKLIER